MTGTTPVRTMFRYSVPLDGTPCRFDLTGDPLAVGALGYSAGIEFWAEYTDAIVPVARTFTIIGTGERIPPGAVYVGTAPRTPEGLVWHLYESTAADLPEMRETFDAAMRSEHPPGTHDIDPANKQCAGRDGHAMIHVAVPLSAMTREQALTHAAWLVYLADDNDEFATYMAAVREGV